ncbi:MAG: hypothetical protein VX822_04280 [Candidatus Neomarinimicrobiota bacterium]|nr:hypothetical protein [Candidatus Neomarinimicrobiota bacterium]
MMAELNLFGKSGFQDHELMSDLKEGIDSTEKAMDDLKAESQQKKETILVKEEAPEPKKVLQQTKPKKKPKAKRKRKYSGHEVFSFLLSSAIIALVLWYFVLKKSIVSTVSEYLPRSFEVHQQNSDD